MNERDEIPIETEEGAQARSGLAERAMVGFVAICLLGAAVILIGRYSADPEAASASPASSSRTSASASADETSRPAPTPRVVAVTPGDVPPSSGVEGAFSTDLWIRAGRDLVIRGEPLLTSKQVGVLKKGEAAVLQQDPGQSTTSGGHQWMLIQQPEPTGWIAVGTATSTFIDRYPWPAIPTSGLIDHLIAGGGRYVAVGAEPRTQDQQPPSWFIASSTDGRTWQRASTTFAGYEPARVAWGPTGWLAIGQVADGQPWLWRSQDALHWTSAGSLGSMRTDRSDLTSITGSALGYMISSGGRGAPEVLWYSPDGTMWVESGLKGHVGADVSVVATSIGFYARVAEYGQSPPSGQADSFSANGRTWSAVQDGPYGYAAQIVDVEGGILAVDADPSSGAIRVLTGRRVAQGELTWIRESASEGPFAGVAFASLASDGQRALLVGSNRSTNAPVAWVGSAGAWVPLALPARAFGGTPTQAIGGPAGFVVAGYRWTLRGENPILWHQVSGGWAPEATPLLPKVPDPGPASCTQPAPADAAAFMVVDRALAAVCFGDAPISFRAYMVPCNGCAGEAGDRFVPEWLGSPTTATLSLAPFVTADGYYTSARLAPTVRWNEAWSRHWVQITGHFDDPASATCRWYPDPMGGGFVAIPQSTIDQCRQEFVVTAVRTLSGP